MNENELRFCASKFPSFKNTNDNFPISNIVCDKKTCNKIHVKFCTKASQFGRKTFFYIFSPFG